MSDPLRNPRVLRVPPAALVILCGPAACGKTTWARRRFRPTEVLSSDGFRALVADDPADQSASADAFRLLEDVAARRLRRGRLTVVDSTALQTGARTALRRLARRYRRRTVLVVFDVDEEECRRRDRRRRRRVGARVIREHRAALGFALRRLPKERYAVAAVLDARGASRVRIVRARS
jgi:protein phosphatase